MVAAVVLGGTHSGVGKSTVALGLAVALRSRGVRVQSFHVGPEVDGGQQYANSINSGSVFLNGWILGQQGAADCLHRHAPAADVLLIDGALGVFDSLGGGSGGVSGAPDGDEIGSTAQLAKSLGLPVVLVVDAQLLGCAQGLAATVQGYATFDPHLSVAGIILNRVGGPQHAAQLTEGLLQAGLRIPVLGSLPRLGPGDGRLNCCSASGGGAGSAAGLGALPQRGAGSQPWGEPQALWQHGSTQAASLQQQQQQQQPLQQQLDAGLLAAAADAHLDVPRLLALAGRAQVPAPSARLALAPRAYRASLAVAQDEVFSSDLSVANLGLLAAAGAQVVHFSPLHDALLPAGVSGLLLGGSPGVVARAAPALARNAPMLAAVRAFAAAGGLVYGEGGGLAYLLTSLECRQSGTLHAMAGLLPLKGRLLPQAQQSRGFVEVQVQGSCPLLPSGATLRGVYHSAFELLEERVVGGLGLGAFQADSGAPAGVVRGREGAGAGGGGGAARSCGTCFAARTAAAVVGGGPAAPEGFTCGTALGSSVLLHLGSCPEAAGHWVQRCQRVNVAAATAAAAAEAGRAAAAAAAAESAEAAADAAPAAKAVAPPPPSGAKLAAPVRRLPSRSRSVPDLRHLGSLALLPGRGGTRGDSKGGPAGKGSPGKSAAWTEEVAAVERVEEGDACGSAKGSGEAALRGSWREGARQGHEPPPLPQQHLVSLARRKSASIPANMDDLGRGGGGSGDGQHACAPLQHLPHQAQQLLAGGVQPQALLQEQRFNVPKRWSLDLQRLGSSLSSHLLHGGRQHADAAASAVAAAGGDAARRRHGGGHARGASHSGAGAGGPLWPTALLEGEEVLPEAAARALTSQLPVSGRTHAKLIGLACPLVGSAKAAPAAPAGAAAAVTRSSMRHSSSAASLHGGVSPPPPHVGAAATCAAAGAPPAPPGSGAPARAQHHAALRTDGIVSLSPSATDCLVALGLAPRLTGVTDACVVPLPPPLPCYAPAPGAQLPQIAPPHPAAPPAPRVVCHCWDGDAAVDDGLLRRLRPALVIVPGDGDERTGHPPPAAAATATAPWRRRPGCLSRSAARAALERSGLLWPDSRAAVLFHDCHTLSEVLEFLTVLGDAAGAPAAAAALAERLRARLRLVGCRRAAAAASANTAAAGRAPPQRVLVLECSPGHSPPALAAAGRWVPELLQLACGGAAPPSHPHPRRPGAPAPPQPPPFPAPAPGDPPLPLSWPDVVASAPDVLLLTSPGLPASAAVLEAAALAALPGFWSLPAVRRGAVYAVASELLLRPGPGLVDGAELLLHVAAQQRRGAPPPPQLPPGQVLRLALQDGQRCRPRLLPHYFVPLAADG